MNKLLFMTDIETVDTKTTAAIASIGACARLIENADCNPRQSSPGLYAVSTPPGGMFHVRVDWLQQTRYPVGGRLRTLSADTIRWWMSQSAEAQKELDGTNQLSASLLHYLRWIDKQVQQAPDNCKVEFWANGVLFDVSILEDAFSQHFMAAPWKFYEIMDFRTMKAQFDVTRPKNSLAHNALHDAEAQMEHLLRILAAYSGAAS